MNVNCGDSCPKNSKLIIDLKILTILTLTKAKADAIKKLNP